MNRRGRFLIVVPLLSMFTVVSLSALAQEPRRPHGEPRASAMRHEHRRFDPRHFDHRMWALGRAYPHRCRWGRCGYWWWADGYWYFYDHPLNGPPEAVSEIAYDEQGNLVPMELKPDKSSPHRHPASFQAFGKALRHGQDPTKPLVFGSVRH
jgi:hypothetical protein